MSLRSTGGALVEPMWTPASVAAWALAGLLFCLLVASLGSLVSRWSETVSQAQKLTFSLMVLLGIGLSSAAVGLILLGERVAPLLPPAATRMLGSLLRTTLELDARGWFMIGMGLLALTNIGAAMLGVRGVRRRRPQG